MDGIPLDIMRSIQESIDRDRSTVFELVIQQTREPVRIKAFIEKKKKSFPSAARMAKRSGRTCKQTRR